MALTVLEFGLGCILALIGAFTVIALLIQLWTRYGMSIYYTGCRKILKH